jgi:hypothetical protein
MNRRPVLIPIFIGCLVAVISCHNNDPAPIVCKPRILYFGTDSVVYVSNEDQRITTVLYYVAGRQTKQDDFTYNSNGKLETLAKLTILVDGTKSLESHHTVAYGSDGLPATLITDSYSGHFITEFTHDGKGRLTHAETGVGTDNWFLGSTRYEYDGNGNIPKIYYTIFVNGESKEVLARENLSFDESEKYYVNSDELKISNEYVYGYLPNRNNCLGSTVYYYSYQQHFSSPLSVTFTAGYNDEGLIRSLESNGSAQLYSGEVLFNNVLYSCR